MLTLIYKKEPHVIVNMSEAASNVALDALGRLMDGGSIELLEASGDVIATLPLSSPAALDATGGELEFNAIGEGSAVIEGRAETGRIVALDGSEVFSCDVGDADSDAVIKLNTTQLLSGQPVRISSFKLAMP